MASIKGENIAIHVMPSLNWVSFKLDNNLCEFMVLASRIYHCMDITRCIWVNFSGMGILLYITTKLEPQKSTEIMILSIHFVFAFLHLKPKYGQVSGFCFRQSGVQPAKQCTTSKAG